VALRALLDTNAYSELKRGHPEVARIVRSSEQTLVSAIVVGELIYGFRRGRRLERNLRELDDFLARPRVALVPATRVTADRFGRIAAALRDQGTPIPTNDIWIAAHAMETGADLVSFDAHFERVAGLAWVRPS
jgi:tRNA(fMet)-specific endonuclease VapC